MQEIERIEDLKRRMMKKVVDREGMPEEVIPIIEEAFNELLNRYRELHCDNLAIQQYIKGSLRQAKVDVTENLGERRKESQLKQVQDICRRIEEELEDADSQLDKARNEETHKQEILQIESGEQHTATRIIGMLEDSLRSVQSRQNRILDAHGASMERIESVQQDAREFIRYFVSRNEMKVYKILEKDNNSLKEQLVTEYEEYLLQSRQDEAKKEEKQTKRKVFVNKLDGNISLDAQRNFAEKHTDKMEATELKEAMDKKRTKRFAR